MTIDDKVLAGMGRAELVVKIHELVNGLDDIRGLNEVRGAEVRFMTSRVAELLRRANEREEETRALKRQVADLTEAVSLARFAFVVGALQRARAKHPNGPGRGGDGMRSLMEEVGEAASALRKETDERVREELLDVVVVALRMYWGE